MASRDRSRLLWLVPALLAGVAVSLGFAKPSPATLRLLVCALAVVLAGFAVALWMALQRPPTPSAGDEAEQRRMEDGMIQAERLRLMGESIAGIAHELNNPLTGVIGYLQLAEREEMAEGLRESLSKAAHEAGRMAQTIRALLSFVRQREPERVPTDLALLLRQVLEFQGHQLEVAGIRVDLDLADMPRALVDPQLIQQVVLNLLKNSEQAIRESGRTGRVIIRAERSGEVFRIAVEDDGPGVPSEEQEKVFEHFFTTKPSGKGTGLGLPICRRIIEAHGGTIRLDPERRRGAAFLIDLPVPAAEPREEGPAGDPTPAADVRVLVVDDEDSVREYVAMVLREEGYEVAEAVGGAAALEQVARHPVDLVFADARMPDMGGIDCIDRIRETLGDHPLRAVLMSGGEVEVPADLTFLHKPMTSEEILKAARG